MENKTKFNYTEAAKLTRLTRQTIAKKVDQGEISAEIDERGKKVIDLSELHRYFGPNLTLEPPTSNVKPPREDMSELTSILRSEIERLVRELDVKQQAHDRDREFYQRELDRLTGIIEKQTLLLPAPKEPEPKKTFWQRMFG